jgi:tRNA (adenine37-N6)-methyltransferase
MIKESRRAPWGPGRGGRSARGGSVFRQAGIGGNARMPDDVPAITMVPIGIVRGGRSEIIDHQWGSVVSRIDLDPAVLDGDATLGLDGFSHIEVIFRFHRTARVRRGAAHPRGNLAWPQVGVLAGHGPMRPNHIGVSCCALLAVDGLQLTVQGLDAIDGTGTGPGHQAVRGRVQPARSHPGTRLDGRADAGGVRGFPVAHRPSDRTAARFPEGNRRVRQHPDHGGVRQWGQR